MKTTPCPVCGEDIDHLDVLCPATAIYTWHPGKTGPDAFGPIILDGDTGDPYAFACPVCGTDLTDDQQRAIEEELR